ncbi:hypothetical protein HMY34_19660 [Thiothrix subterranea]|uniref:hypothetical protein n=1 Tax=Thiothrix subterranea TaxID=2735563 RepID=UPI00192C530D|nr:hypothetical protein [Thiothrix subterranea]QQZ30791.1 hypothetical protein HMY34_19660 [Thiothrix subterranea]
MALPVVFGWGLGLLLRRFGMWLFTAGGWFMSTLLGKLFTKLLIGLIIALALSYYISTEIDALEWLLEYLEDSPAFAPSVTFQSVGSLIQAIRLDDIFLVYINAYVSGSLLRVVFNLNVFRALT